MLIDWITTFFTSELDFAILKKYSFSSFFEIIEILLHIDSNPDDNFDQVQQFELFLLLRCLVKLLDDKKNNVEQIFDENNQDNGFALLHQQ